MSRPQSVLLPDRVSFLLVSEYLLSFVCFTAVSLVVFGAAGLEGDRIFGLALASFSVVAGCFLNGLYRDLQWRSRVALCFQLSSVFGIAFVVQGILSYMHSGLEVSRWVMLFGSGLNFLTMAGWRIAYISLLHRVFQFEPVLFLGCDDVLREIAARILERPELGFSVAGFLSDDEPVGSAILGDFRVVGKFADLAAVVKQLQPKRIMVGVDDMRSRLPMAALVDAKRSGVKVQDAGTAYELVCGRVCSSTFRPSQIIYANELAAKPGVLAIQSIYANLFGLVAFVLAVPVIVVAAIVVRLSSRGPAFLTETYVGMNGIPFESSRLRCTVPGHPERVTQTGRLIRTLHLEFLPRVFNIVRGEMSLVGPAPETVAFAECLAGMIPMYRQRQVVKPGLTGWTQIQNHDELPDVIREIECDLYYTKHLSVALDAYILLHTLRHVLPFD